MWWLIGSAPDFWNPAFITMILMRCRIIVKKIRRSQGREGKLPLRLKKDLKTMILNVDFDIFNREKKKRGTNMLQVFPRLLYIF